MIFKRIDSYTVVIDGVTYVKAPVKQLRERLTKVCKDVDCDIPLEDVSVHVENLLSAINGWLNAKLDDFDCPGSYGDGWADCLNELIEDLN